MNDEANTKLRTRRIELRAEVARLTEERETEHSWAAALGHVLTQFRIVRMPEDLIARLEERDDALAKLSLEEACCANQREDIRRLVEALREWHQPHPASCALCVLLAEMKERYA